MDGTPIRIRRSAVPGKRPTINQLLSGELAYNTYDGELTGRRDRPGIGTDIVRIGAGATVTNILYVTKDGNDTNTGKKLGDAKGTIAGAVAAATAGTVIEVSAGTYVENNPIAIPNQVSIIGNSLREVSVTPQNQGDLFYVGNGNYIAEMSFVGLANTGAIFAFNPNKPVYNNQSPYIQNCTNFIPNSIGMKVDGRYSIGPTKSMVLDSYTQYNQGGIGVSITNEGYAQLVSLFTICPDTAVFCRSGGACDLTNSNASFGNYGLVSDGIGPRKYTGIITSYTSANSNTFVLDLSTPTYNVSGALYDNVSGVTTITTSTNHNFSVGMGITIAGIGFTCLGNPGAGTTTYPSGNSGYVFEVQSIPSSNSFVVNVGPSTTSGQTYTSGGTAKINVTRPFDGQVVYFDNLYYTVGKIQVSSGGTGYNSSPVVTISAPSVSWGIRATAVAEVANGSVTNIQIISSGRGYTTAPTVTIAAPNAGINTSTATLSILPTYYSILSSTPISSGICTITVNDNVPYAVGVGSTVPFFKQSRVLASGHSFEYIGSGTNINDALPAQGGVPIQDNEIDMRNGGLVVFTSTDQSGNFRIGDGVIINQQTGTISGSNFYAGNVLVSGGSSFSTIKVNGISTFSNGPIFIGSGTSTGTASQPLQVTGGAYVSGNVGLGTTNPTVALDVVGGAKFAGVVTATTFSGQVNAGVGTITTLSGTTATYGTGNFTTGNIVTGIVTTLRGTNLNYSGVGTITTLSGTTATYGTGNFTTGNIVTGIVTTLRGTNLNYSGIGTIGTLGVSGLTTTQNLQVTGVSTLGTVRVSSGIITATSGIVTYYGSGTNLTGIVTSIVAGTNITVSGSTGQVTINSSGGGGSISILNDTSTNGTFYVGIASTTTGNLSNLNVSSTKLTFNPSTGNLVVGGTVTANSDKKLKENIKTIENALEKVLSLRGVEYDRIDTGDHQIGVIAQEVEKIIPDVVYGDETKSVAYGNIVGLLIEAIKEQNKEMQELKRKLEGN